MPSITSEPVSQEAERAEMQAVLHSQMFARSPVLTRLLSYLCEKAFTGQTEQIKEYSLAIDVLDRQDSFDPDVDSIVRVQANRLRKLLARYYASEGAAHPLQLTIPVGQYVPVFERKPGAVPVAQATFPSASNDAPAKNIWLQRRGWLLLIGSTVLVALVALMIFIAGHSVRQNAASRAAVPSDSQPLAAEPLIGLPAGEEVRILAGATRKYVDHAGKLWNPDAYFSGGNAVPSSIAHIWRTQDPIIYRNSREGNFTYDIPLKPGIYELHLHFAENFFGPEGPAGGGEGSRMITVQANGELLLNNFDVLADAGGGRTADVKVFTNVVPASDGKLHLAFSSTGGGAMLSAIEILPGIRKQIRPIRIIARDVPYYSNDSHWWSPDVYFKGGQFSTNQEMANATDDPDFYESERWGHFSYAIPVALGRYTLILHFLQRHPTPGSSEDRVFNVFCNGKEILSNLNIRAQAGENRPLMRKIRGLEPNAQGKLLLDFVPVTGYATVTALEVLPE